MSQGQLWLFSKLKVDGTYPLNVALNIVNTFNMEENLNDTPSNMKVKAITSNTYREEFEVNTIAFHPDTTTWWVIKSDTSAYLHTGEYEHEIELVELLEFYSYRHLPNCAFAPNTYTLDQMITRVFAIGKQTDIAVVSPYPSFLDSAKQMPFLSFENFTIANAIKTIARSINAIPKVFANYSIVNDIPIIIDFTLTFINRNGNETAIDSQDLNTKFPIAYEQNANSSDQFLTRSLSNMSNAKSSTLAVLPKQGGFKNISPNSLTYDEDTAKVFLPSKIDKVEFLRIFPPMELVFVNSGGSVLTTFAKGYFINRTEWLNKIVSTSFGGYSTSKKQEIADELPEPNEHFKVNYGETNISSAYDNINALIGAEPQIRMFGRKMTIYNKFEFDTINSIAFPDLKNRSVHWTPFTNELIMPLSFRNGLEGTTDHNKIYRLFRDGITENEVVLRPIYKLSGFFNTKIANDEVYIQVGYYPIADIKVSYDNDNDAQDEKFFNQSGKVIDSFSTSQLIISHTNDSVEGTKIRNARYDNYANIVPLGQIVRDNNELYVVSQRSIDMMFRDNGNNYFNVIYTLSKNRIARSENIQADSAVINYKTPDDNLVKRSQLYKDYIELSLVNITPKDIPYLSMGKALVIDSQFAGTDFDFTVLAKNTYDSTTIRYVQSPTIFDLAKAKLFNVSWQDNNILGFRLDSTNPSSYVQTPIVYTNDIGKATNFELLALDTTNITNARTFYNSNYTPNDLIPFGDLTNVNNDFYTNSVFNLNNFSIRIPEPTYDKDPFEIPVFEYMIQGNDDYNALGNVIIGNELFTSYSKNFITYNYVVSTTRFTAENANRLFTIASPAPSSSVQRVIITRPNDTTINLKLFSTLVSTVPPIQLNGTALQGKHIGIFAIGFDGTRKFLFAINDYNMVSNNDINLYINNWKI
jgi:hypothetical protein